MSDYLQSIMAFINRAKNFTRRVIIQADALRSEITAQDLIEYALMAGFVAVAAGSIMPGVAVNISRIFSQVGSILFNSKNQGS